MNASLVKLYLSVLIGAFFPLGIIIAPFMYYSLVKADVSSAQAIEVKRHLKDIVNFQIQLYLFLFTYLTMYWCFQIYSYNGSFEIGWLYIPVILYVILDVLYPLFIVVHLKMGKRGKRYYYSFVRFF